ncbi:MAG TPA: hypothetical protein VH593_05720, partial [Ktedonobacteraceae bacterium]
SVGYKAVERHIEHISQEIKTSHAAAEEAQTLDVVRQLREINIVTLAIMKESRVGGNNGTALFAIDRVLKQLELQAKLLGDLDEQKQEQGPIPVELLPFLEKDELDTIEQILQRAEQRKLEAENITVLRKKEA